MELKTGQLIAMTHGTITQIKTMEKMPASVEKALGKPDRLLTNAK